MTSCDWGKGALLPVLTTTISVRATLHKRKVIISSACMHNWEKLLQCKEGTLQSVTEEQQRDLVM